MAYACALCDTTHDTIADAARCCEERFDDPDDLVTDGGQETVLACLECDRSELETVNTGRSLQADHDHDYRCVRCGATFDDPVERPPRGTRNTQSGLAKALAEADPEDLVTDGGEVAPLVAPGTLQRALHTWGENLQQVIAVEACAELITTLAQIERWGDEEQAPDTEDLLEELADARIMIDQLALAIDPVAFQQEADRQVDRLEDLISNERELGTDGGQPTLAEADPDDLATDGGHVAQGEVLDLPGEQHSPARSVQALQADGVDAVLVGARVVHLPDADGDPRCGNHSLQSIRRVPLGQLARPQTLTCCGNCAGVQRDRANLTPAGQALADMDPAEFERRVGGDD